MVVGRCQVIKLPAKAECLLDQLGGLLYGFWAAKGLSHQMGHYQVLPSGENVVGNVLIDSLATVGKNSIIGSNAVIEDGVRVAQSAILEGAKLKAHFYILMSIIGW